MYLVKDYQVTKLSKTKMHRLQNWFNCNQKTMLEKLSAEQTRSHICWPRRMRLPGQKVVKLGFSEEVQPGLFAIRGWYSTTLLQNFRSYFYQFLRYGPWIRILSLGTAVRYLIMQFIAILLNLDTIFMDTANSVN